MSDSLEQIVVEYKLDVSTLKQQFEQMKADLQGLKSTAENSSREAGEHIKGHIGKGVDDTRETFKKFGTELKQVFAFTQTNEAVKQLQNLDKAAVKASKEVTSLEKAITKNKDGLNKLGEGATSNSAKIEKLQGQLAAKQAEISKMAEQGKEHLQKYGKAIEQAAKWQEKLNGYGDKTKEIQQKTEELNKALQENTDKLKAAKGAAEGLQVLSAGSHLVKGLTSSFDAANSALHLFAGENEKMQKGLIQVHEAMNLAKGVSEAFAAVQGISAAANATKTATVAGETVAQETNTAATWLGTAAQEALNLVMNANPIAAVIGLVTGLVAAITYFISSSDKAAEKQKKLNEEQKNGIEVSKRKLDAAKDESDMTIKTAERNREALKRQGAGAKDLQDAEDKLSQARIDASQKQMDILGVSAKGFDDYKKKYLADQNELLAKIETAHNNHNKKEEEELNKSLELLKQNFKLKEDAVQTYLDNVAAKEEVEANRKKQAAADAEANKAKKAEDAKKWKEETEKKLEAGDQKTVDGLKHKINGIKDFTKEKLDLINQEIEAEKKLEENRLKFEKATQEKLDLLNDEVLAKKEKALKDFEEENKKVEVPKTDIKAEVPAPEPKKETAPDPKAIADKALQDAVEAAKNQSAAVNKIFDDIKSKSEEAIKAISSVVNTIFSNALNKLKNDFTQSQTELNNWQQKAMQGAEGNTKKQAAIQRIYHAEQIQMAHQKAIKEAEIARKQAEYTKATKILEITLNTASTLAKDYGLLTVAQASLDPVQIAAATAALIEAAAIGAVQLGVAAAAPLPPIPKFATGVVGYKGRGTETSDSNPVLISHNESIITAAATKKYTAELEAINNLTFENLLLEKYLLPALKNTTTHKTHHTPYDDWLLRKDIREGNHLTQKNAKYLETIATAVKYHQLQNGRYLS